MVLAGMLLLLAMLVAPANNDDAMLAVPYRNQLNGTPYARANCGPTALAMVLAYYDIDASPWDVRVKAMRAQHSWVDDEGGYSDGYGVFVYNLATVAESFGLEAVGLVQLEGGRADRLRRWDAADLRRQIRLGRPVIVQVEYRALPGNTGSMYDEDHYLVVHGLIGDDFVYSDPLGIRDRGPNLVVDEATLLNAMSGASSPRAAFAVRRASS